MNDWSPLPGAAPFFETILDEAFRFTPRPKPLPADMRVLWKVPLLLIILKNSRMNTANLSKVHAIFSSVLTGEDIPANPEDRSNLHRSTIRHDPSVSSAIEIAVGLGFIKRAGRQMALTAKGSGVADIVESGGVLREEITIIQRLSPTITGASLDRVLRSRR